MNTPETPIDVSSSVDQVSAALVLAQGSVKAAEFDATNPFFKSRYATLGAVIEASRGALFNAGLAILQKPTITENLVTLQTTIVHKSGQSLDGGTMSLPLEGNDRNSDCQVAGSILTYLKRYSWASVLGIYADADTDGIDAPKGSAKPPGRFEQPKPPQHTTQAPKTAPTGHSAPNQATQEPKATAAFRMAALNNLKGAPGQPNRGLVEAYLRSKLWISGDQAPEAWSLEHVPATKEGMAALQEDLVKFEVSQREQNQQPA